MAFVFLSNHFHLLLLPESTRQLAAFMTYLASNIAREVGRLHQWREKFWARRYHAIPVSNEEAAQLGRLRYLLAHGAKEGFVAHPRDWPGPHAIHALIEGAPIQGTWFDRTALYEARRGRSGWTAADFESVEAVSLTPIPCWAHLPESQRRQRIGEMLVDIERDSKTLRDGRPPLGRAAILRQDPHRVSRLGKRTPAPALHVATRAAWDALREAYRCFVNAFRRASELLRSGARPLEFPDGCFPPPFPYVPINSS